MVQQSLIALLLLPMLALAAPQHKGWQSTTTTEAAAAVASAPVATSAPANTASISRSASQGGRVTLKNNCAYEVSLDALAPSGCYASGPGKVAAGSTWEDALDECSSANTALKVYANGGSKPMQFEYGLLNGMLWYDMSFIDCLTTTSDFSECAGGGWKMSSMGNCQTFACSGGPECCGQGYCDPYATNLAIDPTAGCGANEGYSVSDTGVHIELCAS